MQAAHVLAARTAPLGLAKVDETAAPVKVAARLARRPETFVVLFAVGLDLRESGAPCLRSRLLPDARPPLRARARRGARTAALYVASRATNWSQRR